MNYWNIGGEDGMRITRAAFAVMIKFSDLDFQWHSCIDSVMLNEEDEAEALDEIREHYKPIVDRFKQATRMRQWISQQKLERTEKHEKDLTEALKLAKKTSVESNEPSPEELE